MRVCAVSLALLALVLAPLAGHAQAQTPAIRIGYVDLQKVMVESEKGKEARKLLADELEKRKKEVSQRQDELQKMKDSLEKQSAMITQEARAEKEKQYQIKLKDYQRITNDFQSEAAAEGPGVHPEDSEGARRGHKGDGHYRTVYPDIGEEPGRHTLRGAIL